MKLETVKNYFFIVKESWFENIKLLKPENISKLLLVSLRASVESLRSVFLYLLIFFVLLFFKVYFKIGGLYLTHFINLSLLFLLILSLRASVALKNQKYYLAHLGYIIPAIWVYLVYCFVDRSFDIKLFIFPVLWMFFTIDSKLNIKNFFISAYRALLMLILNLPVFLIIRFILFGVINLLKLSKLPINYFVPNLPVYTSLIFYIIIYLLLTYFVALVGKIYIKRVHEQFNLYF